MRNQFLLSQRNALLVLLPLALSFVVLRAPTIQFDVHFEMVPNLIRQLDVVSDSLSNGRKGAYQVLWEEKFLNGNEDREYLKTWATIQNRLQQDQRVEPKRFPITPVRLPFGKSIETRVAGLNSTSVAEFQSKISSVLVADDVNKLTEVLHHFEDRFKMWWDSEAAVKGADFRSQMQKLVVDPRVTDSVISFFRFYRPEIDSNSKIPFHLMYKPKIAKDRTNGEQVSNTAMVEFVEGEKPANRIDIIIHELCHYFFWTGSSKNHIQLQKDFLSSKSLASVPCFNVMNEALATTLGNGMVAEKFMKPEGFQKYMDQKGSWYGNFAIDGSAKSTFTWLKDYIAKGGSLFDRGFAKTYSELIEKGTGDAALSPQMNLMSANYIVGGGWTQDVFGTLMDAIQSTYSSAGISDDVQKAWKNATAANPNISSIVVIRSNELAKISSICRLTPGEQEAISSKLTSDKACGFAKRTNNYTMVYILIAEDMGKIGELAEKLGSSLKPIIGVFSLPK